MVIHIIKQMKYGIGFIALKFAINNRIFFFHFRFEKQRVADGVIHKLKSFIYLIACKREKIIHTFVRSGSVKNNSKFINTIKKLLLRWQCFIGFKKTCAHTNATIR